MSKKESEAPFTKIDNTLLEGIQQYKFTTNQYKVIMVIWRYIYGFHREQHSFSLTFLQNATFLDRKAVSRALTDLIMKKVIFEIQKGGGNKSKILSFNLNLNDWKVDKYATAINNTAPCVEDSKNTKSSGRNATSSSGEYATTGSGQNATKERKVKESIKEKRYIDFPIDGHSFLEIYNFYFKQKFNTNHMKIHHEKETYIISHMEHLEKQEKLYHEEFEEIVSHHFDNLPPKNNGSILPFIEALPRYIQIIVRG